MKNKIILFGASFLLAFLIFGCSTTSTNPINSILGGSNEQSVVTTGVSVLVTQELQSNPSELPTFEAAETGLSLLTGETNAVTLTQVDALLQSSGQNDSTLLMVAPLLTNVLNEELKNNTNSVIGTSQAGQIFGWASAGVSQGIQQYELMKSTTPANVAVTTKTVVTDTNK
jgi:hypothetical protein